MATETGIRRLGEPKPGNEVVCSKETWPDAAVLDRLFTGAPAQDLLAYALKEPAPGQVAAASSLAADSAVPLHLSSSAPPAPPPIFLTTRNHLPDTPEHPTHPRAHFRPPNVHSLTPHSPPLRALYPTRHRLPR